MTTGDRHTVDAAKNKSVSNLLVESGNVELQAGRLDQALALYKQSIKLDSRNALAHNAMGMTLVHMNKMQGALEAFSQAYLITPDDPGIVENLVATLINVGRYKTAATLATKPGALLNYPIAVTAVSSYLTSPDALQDQSLQDLSLVYDNLARELGSPANPAERALFLFANFMHPQSPWRESALSFLPNETFPKWVSVKGLEKLKQHQAAGKGAILLSSHTAIGHTVLPALIRQGLKLYSIEFNNRFSTYRIHGIENVNFLEVGGKDGFALREVYLAQKALQGGEIVHLAGDGYQGNGGEQCAFLGRQRAFRTGFAELSLLTDTPVFPVFCTTSLEGVITVDILPPLEKSDTNAPREAQIRGLIQQYIALLEQCWRTMPENISWRHAARHLRSTDQPNSVPEAPAI